MPGGTAPLGAYLAELRDLIERELGAILASSSAPPLLADAMRYALLGGGKRLRPCLTLAVADALGGPLDEAPVAVRQRALPAACAIEMVHTYSLVHDDLPAMDDDALRRGQPTTHVVYGDGLAILVGDGLLTEAFTVLTGDRTRPGTAALTAEQRIRLVALLASAAGAAGMVGGQAIDLAAAGRVPSHHAPITSTTALADMHARKTGALIRAACGLGAVTANATSAELAAIDAYATELGLAFQIVDDVLDVESSSAALGKTAGKDVAAGKPTYPAFYGIEKSRHLAAACVDRAKAALATIGFSGRLAAIAEWSLERRA